MRWTDIRVRSADEHGRWVRRRDGLQGSGGTQHGIVDERRVGLNGRMILHICPSAAWHDVTDGQYRCRSLETEGFIHCSTPEQVIEVANYLFRGQRGLVLLVIDSERVRARILDEDAGNGKLYPHIYGPLNIDAVVRTAPFEPRQDGTFTLPSGFIPSA